LSTKLSYLLIGTAVLNWSCEPQCKGRSELKTSEYDYGVNDIAEHVDSSGQLLKECEVYCANVKDGPQLTCELVSISPPLGQKEDADPSTAEGGFGGEWASNGGAGGGGTGSPENPGVLLVACTYDKYGDECY
jgi:hypothetical protein